MWDGRQVVVPKGFKHTIGKINENFRGDEQQDAQEYLNFLIDGLHEETNLRKLKPYIENPESDGRDLIELGLESWSNSLRRDWSFVFFAFYGQLKSTLECLTCKKESTNYEVFTSIPVSLAEPSQLLLNVIVHRLPSKIKNVVMDPRLRAAEDSFDQSINGAHVEE
jgi:ubiquitin carboxyl-terminal hydrolase 8